MIDEIIVECLKDKEVQKKVQEKCKTYSHHFVQYVQEYENKSELTNQQLYDKANEYAIAKTKGEQL